MEILERFGVDWTLLVAQIINFLIILYILKKFMYKPVLDTLKKRENQIRQGLKDAEEAEIKLREAEEKESAILKRARLQADKIVADAKSEADALRAKTEESSKKDTEKMMIEARATIEGESRKAEDALTQKIGDIAILLLEKSLKGVFGEKEQRVLLERATKEIRRNSI